MFLRTILLVLCLGTGLLAQNGTILVLAKQANQLLFIDAASGKKVGSMAVGEGPHEITISTDGRKAYVANYGNQVPGSILSIIDVSTRQELKRLDLSPLKRPHGLFAYADKIFVTAEMNRAIARIDTKSDSVDWIMGTGQAGTHMVVGSADGKTIYTANIPSNSVSRIDLSRGGGVAPDAIAVTNVPKQPEGIALSPDGKELWVGSNGEGMITILNAETLAPIQTLRGHQVPIRIRFTPDGLRALVSDPQAAEVTIYDAKSRKEVKRLKISGTPIGSVISKDGSRAYVASMVAGKVAVIDLKSLEVIAMLDAPGGPDGITLVE
jgi:DNA-binding beta-propeller fold protein YncE